MARDCGLLHTAKCMACIPELRLLYSLHNSSNAGSFAFGVTARYPAASNLIAVRTRPGQRPSHSLRQPHGPVVSSLGICWACQPRAIPGKQHVAACCHSGAGLRQLAEHLADQAAQAATQDRLCASRSFPSAMQWHAVLRSRLHVMHQMELPTAGEFQNIRTSLRSMRVWAAADSLSWGLKIDCSDRPIAVRCRVSHEIAPRTSRHCMESSTSMRACLIT